MSSGSYFNYYISTMAHQSTPTDGINVYSFSIHPESHQPSGSANFSSNSTYQEKLIQNEINNSKVISLRQKLLRKREALREKKEYLKKLEDSIKCNSCEYLIPKEYISDNIQCPSCYKEIKLYLNV